MWCFYWNTLYSLNRYFVSVPDVRFPFNPRTDFCASRGKKSSEGMCFHKPTCTGNRRGSDVVLFSIRAPNSLTHGIERSKYLLLGKSSLVVGKWWIRERGARQMVRSAKVIQHRSSKFEIFTNSYFRFYLTTKN